MNALQQLSAIGRQDLKKSFSANSEKTEKMLLRRVPDELLRLRSRCSQGSGATNLKVAGNGQSTPISDVMQEAARIKLVATTNSSPAVSASLKNPIHSRLRDVAQEPLEPDTDARLYPGGFR